MKGWHWIALDLEDAKKDHTVYIDQGLLELKQSLRKHNDFELYIRRLATQDEGS